MKILKFVVFFLMFAVGCGSAILLRPVPVSPLVEVPAPPLVEVVVPVPLRVIDDGAEFNRERSGRLWIDMVETGNGFHGDEIVARNGEQWTGLFPDENGVFTLRKVTVDVTPAKDEIIDETGTMSGKNVQTKEKSIPVFLLRGASSLKTGEVRHLFGLGDLTVGEDGRDYASLKEGFSRTFDAGGGGVTLKVVRGIAGGRESQAIVLERGEASQTLYVFPFPDADSIGTLYWVGDIDRDGWPDFYMSLYYHDNVLDKMLFLSSRAKRNKIVSLVASFRITGC